MLDRTKRDRERLKDAGCVLNDIGEVISGVPPFELVAGGTSGSGGGAAAAQHYAHGAVVAVGGVTVDAPDEAQIDRSLKNILNEDTGDAGIAAMLADADKGMAELLHDLDMAPQKSRKTKKKIHRKKMKNDPANTEEGGNDENGAWVPLREKHVKSEEASPSPKRRRRRAAAGPPGGNAKTRYAKLVKRRRRREDALSNLSSIVSRISENLNRGLGVSGAMLDELEAARRACEKNSLVPPTNSVLIECFDLQERMEIMPRTSISAGDGGGHTGGTSGIAPSVAWATSGNGVRMTHGQRRNNPESEEEDEPFSAPLFIDDEFSDNSDDEDEPFLVGDIPHGNGRLENAPTTMFSASGPGAHLQPPKLPSQRDEASIIAAAAAAVKSASQRAAKKQKIKRKLAGGGSTIGRGHRSSSDELDAAILERRAMMANTAYGTNERGGTHNQSRTNKSQSQTSVMPHRSRQKSESPSKRRSGQGKKNKTSTKTRKTKKHVDDTHVDMSVLSPLRGKMRRKPGKSGKAGTRRSKNGFPVIGKSASMSFLPRGQQGQLFGAKHSKFDQAMADMIESENRELAREIHRRKQQQKPRANVFVGRRQEAPKASRPLTYNEVRRGMMQDGAEDSAGENGGDRRVEEDKVAPVRSEKRRKKGRRNSPSKRRALGRRSPGKRRAAKGANNKSPDPPSPSKRRGRKKKKKKKKRGGSLSPGKRRRLGKHSSGKGPNKKAAAAFSKLQILSDEHDARMLEGAANAMASGESGGLDASGNAAVFKSRMPPQLRNNSALRKVVCLLVLGQLTDVRKLLEIHARNGVHGLAKRFSAGDDGPEGTGLSEDAAWMLENFVCVGQVFVNVWEKRRRQADSEDANNAENLQYGASSHGKNKGMIIPGVCRGADVDARIPSTAPDVTMEACGLVRQFLRWFDIPSGLARYHILHGMALWGQDRPVDALDAWRAGALSNKADGAPPDAGNGNAQLNRYDRAVACFLLGRHSVPGLVGSMMNNGGRGQSRGATPGSERLRWLRRARRGFREIFDATPADEEEDRCVFGMVVLFVLFLVVVFLGKRGGGGVRFVCFIFVPCEPTHNNKII